MPSVPFRMISLSRGLQKLLQAIPPAVIVVGRHNFESLFARSEEFPSGAANASWFATRISVILNILNSLAAATVVEFHLLNSTTRSNDFLIVVRSCRIHVRSTITLSPSDPLSPKQYYYRENWAESLAKRNHEFESNPLRQPVSPFLSLGGVLPENSILRPKTREYRMDKHLTSVSNGQQGGNLLVFLRGRVGQWSFAS